MVSLEPHGTKEGEPVSRLLVIAAGDLVLPPWSFGAT